MKNFLTTTLFLVLLFSCDTHEDTIEIYLLKERIRSDEGTPVLNYAKQQNIKYQKELENVKGANYDSISKEFIWGGEFKVTQAAIQDRPLINDDEILMLNLKKNELLLSESGKKKIQHLKPNMAYGVQFVICVNKEACLTGYFRSNVSSNIYNWNYISYDYFTSNIATIHDENFVIRQNEGYQKWKPILIDLNKYPKLVAAFRNTDRLEK